MRVQRTIGLGNDRRGEARIADHDNWVKVMSIGA